MTSDDEAPDLGARTPQRGYVRFSATLARAICRRVAAGETQAQICADPQMPSQASLHRWAKQRSGFAQAFTRARALGGRGANGRGPSFCAVAAAEIVARVSEGEMLSSVCAEAHLPSLRTVMRWRAGLPEFAEDLRLAREALAERFSDLGWKLAMEATPETAFLTQVRLKQLRWTAAVLGPRTHGRLKPGAAPQPPEFDTVVFSHFEIERHPQTGQRRVVAYTADPDTMLPVRDSEGPWTGAIDTAPTAANSGDTIPNSRRADASVEPARPAPPSVGFAARRRCDRQAIVDHSPAATAPPPPDRA